MTEHVKKGELVDFMSTLHQKTKRDYLARVNDKAFPKQLASKLARNFDFHYWDGDRRINYGGYNFLPGRFEPVAKGFIEKYALSRGSRILDVGCGKGFQLAELLIHEPGLKINGIDISSYAIENCMGSLQERLIQGCASSLPYPDNYFDFVFSINTLHNLTNNKLQLALSEINRVSKESSYICVESYRNIDEMTNLLYWQVTCEQFCSEEEWLWWFDLTNYQGDYSFIYFE